MLSFDGHSSYSSQLYSSLKCSTPQDVESPRDEDDRLISLSPRFSYQFYYTSAELVNEITTLEDEITHLERYLLSLYREAFQQNVHCSSAKCETELQNRMPIESKTITDQSHLSSGPNFCKDHPVQRNCINSPNGLEDSDDWNHARTLKSSSQRDRVVVEHGHRSLADYLVASRINKNLTRPDRLSEDIVRCISSIYIKLADPTLCHTGLSASSVSSLSSSSAFSPINLSDNWCSRFSEEARGRQIQGLNDECEQSTAMFEVLKISLDDDSFNYAARVLQNFRLLVNNLEKVEPAKMKHEEKLAFWINIHNALVMHAHLAYGTTNHVKSALILKAAYNIGGHCINADIIQSSILGIRSHYAAPWLDTLLSPGKKFKAVKAKHIYAVEYPEPLVHFALSSGVYSDPAVRLYTASSISEDLKLARDDFIKSSVYIHKESKICLPRILEYFARDMSLNMAALLEIVYGCLPEIQQKAAQKCGRGRPDKYITWLPPSSAFRYVIHTQLLHKKKISSFCMS